MLSYLVHYVQINVIYFTVCKYTWYWFPPLGVLVVPLYIQIHQLYGGCHCISKSTRCIGGATVYLNPPGVLGMPLYTSIRTVCNETFVLINWLHCMFTGCCYRFSLLISTTSASGGSTIYSSKLSHWNNCLRHLEFLAISPCCWDTIDANSHHYG